MGFVQAACNGTPLFLWAFFIRADRVSRNYLTIKNGILMAVRPGPDCAIWTATPYL
jgi:hypothetical protein